MPSRRMSARASIRAPLPTRAPPHRQRSDDRSRLRFRLSPPAEDSTAAMLRRAARAVARPSRARARTRHRFATTTGATRTAITRVGHRSVATASATPAVVPPEPSGTTIPSGGSGSWDANSNPARKCPITPRGLAPPPAIHRAGPSRRAVSHARPNSDRQRTPPARSHHPGCRTLARRRDEASHIGRRLRELGQHGSLRECGGVHRGGEAMRRARAADRHIHSCGMRARKEEFQCAHLAPAVQGRREVFPLDPQRLEPAPLAQLGGQVERRRPRAEATRCKGRAYLSGQVGRMHDAIPFTREDSCGLPRITSATRREPRGSVPAILWAGRRNRQTPTSIARWPKPSRKSPPGWRVWARKNEEDTLRYCHDSVTPNARISTPTRHHCG